MRWIVVILATAMGMTLLCQWFPFVWQHGMLFAVVTLVMLYAFGKAVT